MQNTTNPAVTAKPRRKYRDPENMVTSFSMPRKLLEEAKLIAASEALGHTTIGTTVDHYLGADS